MNTREMTRIFNRVDVNGSGVIDYSGKLLLLGSYS